MGFQILISNAYLGQLLYFNSKILICREIFTVLAGIFGVSTAYYSQTRQKRYNTTFEFHPTEGSLIAFYDAKSEKSENLNHG
mgnify:CR=1 FL=1